MIKDMHEEIRMEKYNMERQALLEEQDAQMRKVQLEETQCVLRNYKDAFVKYVAVTEEEENVNTLFFCYIYCYRIYAVNIVI